MAGVGWITLYLLLALVAAGWVWIRRDATFYSGRTFLAYNLMFAIVAVTASFWQRASVSPILLGFLALAIILALLARGIGVVFRADVSEVAAVLERCLMMIRAPFSKTDLGYSVRVGEAAFDIALRAALGSSTFVLVHRAPSHRKVDLLRSLFSKQFLGVLPRIQIRL